MVLTGRLKALLVIVGISATALGAFAINDRGEVGAAAPMPAGIHFHSQFNSIYHGGVPLAPDIRLDTEPLDCISCHPRQLAYHDRLGQGNGACWTCHVSTDPTMSTLHLANGTSLTFTETPRLCGQCHQGRYLAWQEGTHGVPGTVAAVPCTTCHDPHQPQMAFLGITKPPPPPLNFIVELPREAAIFTGIAIIFLLGLAIILARREDVL